MALNKKIRKTLATLVIVCAIPATCCFSMAAFGSDSDSTAASTQSMDEIRISYLGPEGTYTEEATQSFFSSGTFQPKETVPEGSQLGTYNYIIEVENESGMSGELIEKLEKIPEIRCLGSFNVVLM